MNNPSPSTAGPATLAMQVPLLDLQAQYETIKSEIEDAALSVLRSQRFILGPVVEKCEQAVADYCNVAHAVGVSSGTDALLIALLAEGIGEGDEVITTPFTFFATAGSIARAGARPIFADIRPDTFNIDPEQLERRISPRTRAIIPVHLFGQAADLDPIIEIAHRHDLTVIEDAAQAIGAEYRGARAGSLGHYGCYSFFPSKNLGCAGDGGMVVTQDADRAERLRVLRAHGSQPKYFHQLVGGNFRLDAIHAAIVSVKLRHLDGWTAGRQRNARLYDQLLQDTGLVERQLLTLPCVTETRHIFNQYVIRASDRDRLREHLRSSGVGTEVYYPLSLHEQQCFGYLGYRRGDFPKSESAAAETLALPIYPELRADQLEYVAAKISEFYG